MAVLDMSPTTEDWLLKRQDEIFRDLINADDRATRAALVAELREKTKDLDALRGSKRFGACRKPIDAIEQYLEAKGSAATEEEIIREVIRGGFGAGDESERNPIFWSLRVFLNGTGKKTNRLRQLEEGGPIGLYKWPDSHFQ